MTRSKQFRLLQLLRPKICAIDEICDPVKWWRFQRASFWSFYLFLRLLYREGKLFLFFYRSDGSRRKCSLRFNLVQSFSSIRGSNRLSYPFLHFILLHLRNFNSSIPRHAFQKKLYLNHGKIRRSIGYSQRSFFRREKEAETSLTRACLDSKTPVDS